MNSLYNLALRQSSSIQSDLTLIESTSDHASSSASLVGQLTASLAALSRTVDDYENMAKREMNVQKREKALQRIKKFREEEKEMQNAFNKVKAKTNGVAPESKSTNDTSTLHQDSAQSTSTYHQPNSNHLSALPQSALHSRAPTYQSLHNNTNGIANAHGALPPQDRPNPLQAYRMNASAAAMFGDREHSMREGYALREHSFIQQTETQLDSFIAQGKEVWTNLTEQRDILKGTQRRLRDVGVTLGLSRDVIGYIERRSTQDNILFVVGAIFTLICFYYIYKWFG
ncbi:uncharacterized protein FA14DRAFT_116981 [Meira miltonrushii]|uniref:Protein transport protein BOS1 n=1 Tax=Meira miltonrushii TaxID=1280837 RepID=A0A316VKG2_9BASI|nr:uncharacterized protein FA14DRAFT_116981 [Meira miltonrushii]PWN37538.1 hypothetical protein FA14DRAFT_116981 [Meira miltonrushii]